MRARSGKLSAMTALGAVFLLGLTGCATSGASGTGKADNGSPTDAQASDKWDFTNTDAMSQMSSITFTINDDLVETATEYAENSVLESVKVTGLETGSPRYCAVKFEFEYANGNATVTTIEDATWYDDDDMTKALGNQGERRFIRVLGLLRGQVIAEEPDLEKVDTGGTWISADRRTAVSVTTCASSPYDPKTLESHQGALVGFSQIKPATQPGTMQSSALAEVRLSVMKDGSITVVDSEVNGFVRDSNGTWIVG